MMPPTLAKLLPEWQRLLELYCYDLRMMIGETRFQRGCLRPPAVSSAISAPAQHS